MKSLIQPLLSAALLFELTPAVESRINWGGDWDGVTDWSEIPEGVFVGPGGKLDVRGAGTVVSWKNPNSNTILCCNHLSGLC